MPVPPSPPSPPSLLRATVSLCLPVEDRAAVLGDLDELFAERVTRGGGVSAVAWYTRQTAGFVGRVATARIAEHVGGADSWVTDARLALRTFRRRPSFAIAVVLTLGVASGALVSVYAAADSLLLRPVPGVARPHELMTMRLGSTVAPPHVSWDVSHPDFLTLRERLRNGAIAARSRIDADVRPPGGVARRVAGELVTSNYFDVLGHTLFAGRPFSPEEERLGSRSAVAILSYPLARSLHSDATRVIGTQISLNGSSVEVVGVGGPGFRGADLPGRADVWLPLGALTIVDPSAGLSGDARGIPVWRQTILRSSVSPTEISAAANGVMAAVQREFKVHSFTAPHYTFVTSPGVGLDPGVRRSVQRTLGLVAGAALFLLALAIANLVNLGLMEATTRGAGTAVRFALGSTRARMLRGLVIEAVLLALGGAALAIGLAVVWSRVFQDTQLSEHGGALAGMQVNLGVIGASVVVAAVAALLALVNPVALRRKQSLEGLLRRGNSGTPERQRLRMTLVGVQLAVTLLLLVSAGLLTGSASNLRGVDLGFSPDRLLVFSIDPHLHGYESERLGMLVRDIEARLVEQAGVSSAGFVSPSPLRSSYFTAAFYDSEDADHEGIVGAGYYVTPGFLPALNARIVAGPPRWGAERGTIVITRASLEKLYPGVPPDQAVGRMLHAGRRRGKPVRIAAVIEDVRLSDIVSDPPPSFFRPLQERPAGLSVSGFVATARAPMSLAPAVSGVLQTRAPELPVFDLRTARSAVDLQFAELSAVALVAKTLSGIGLLLSAIGFYGVMANAVNGRRRELGIRAALGAAPGRLLASVLVTGFVPMLVGTIAGLAAAVPASRLIAQYLFGLEASTPQVYAAAVGVIVMVAALACAIPAYRASLVSPASVLREE